MNSAQLRAEFDAGVDRVRQSHLDRIVALGVLPATIYAIGREHHPLGVMSVSVSDDGMFEPGGDVPVLVQPVIEGSGLIDLVAWNSADPAKWWLRSGSGWLLNAYRCLGSRWDSGVLDLSVSPLAWLQGGAKGGVIVDWETPDLATLRQFDTVNCETPALAATFSNAVLRPRHDPIVTIPEELRHAA